MLLLLQEAIVKSGYFKTLRHQGRGIRPELSSTKIRKSVFQPAGIVFSRSSVCYSSKNLSDWQSHFL